MPALLESGFFVRKPAWHGQGTVLAEYPGRDEAMRLAGHTFEVVEREVAIVENGVVGSGPIAGWKALVRSDTSALLHVARDSYAVIQNTQPWDLLDAVLGQEHVKYDTAGVLDQGAVLWVTALVDEPSMIAHDPSPIFPFVAAWWSHDGSGACTIDQTSVRRVCMNTHRAASAEADRTGKTFTFRHVGAVGDRIAAARDVLAGVRTGFRAFIEVVEDLAALSVSDAGIEAFVRAFLPMPPEHAISETVKGHVLDARKIVTANLDGPTCEGIRNTAWGLACAATEYLDYGRGFRSPRTLLNRTILKGDRAKDEVFALSRRTAEVYAK